MAFSDAARRFAKDLPGADLVFQPPDIADYADDAWDIRITIGDAPLEEAYYFTIDDPDAVGLTIEELLDSYALNADLRSKLEVEEYPDLPFLQEELIQYRTNERQRLIELDFYVNHNPSSAPVRLRQTARNYLSVCTYHDGSHDYRVLDLVLVPTVPNVYQDDINRMQREYGEVFLLMLLDYHLHRDEQTTAEFLKEPPVVSCLGRWPKSAHRKFANGMKELHDNGLIVKSAGEDAMGRPTGDEPGIELTDAGQAKLEGFMQEYRDAAEYYDRFDSVAIAPPALGVPGGFDARVQMMEFDGRDCERTVLIQVLVQNRDQLFAAGQWHEAYDAFSVCRFVREAMAYKTNFSTEVLEALKHLAGA